MSVGSSRNAAISMTVASHAPEETSRIGARLGRALRAGDVILARGDLGAGKTAFARGVARGLAINGPIPSPTFTLANEYEGRNAAGEVVPLVHIDLYRLGEGGDIDSLGLDDYLGGAWAVVIEWPERALDGGMMPATFLDLAITDTGGDSRMLTFTAYGDARALLDALGPGM